MVWVATQRNFDQIQHEDLRKVIDNKYNQVHDELSDCYYNRKKFRTFGFLNKATFDKLHGLIFLLHEVALDAENKKLATPYADIILGPTVQQRIDQLATEGIVLTI